MILSWGSWNYGRTDLFLRGSLADLLTLVTDLSHSCTNIPTVLDHSYEDRTSSHDSSAMGLVLVRWGLVLAGWRVWIASNLMGTDQSRTAHWIPRYLSSMFVRLRHLRYVVFDYDNYNYRLDFVQTEFRKCGAGRLFGPFPMWTSRQVDILDNFLLDHIGRCFSVGVCFRVVSASVFRAPTLTDGNLLSFSRMRDQN